MNHWLLVGLINLLVLLAVVGVLAWGIRQGPMNRDVRRTERQRGELHV